MMYHIKGYLVFVRRAGIGGAYEGSARKGYVYLRTPRMTGKGAKDRALEAIKEMIDQAEAKKEGQS